MISTATLAAYMYYGDVIFWLKLAADCFYFVPRRFDDDSSGLHIQNFQGVCTEMDLPLSRKRSCRKFSAAAPNL